MLLKKKAKALPKCARFYLNLKTNKINPVIFITDVEEAAQVKKDMEGGKNRILCDLEVTMMKDINIFWARKKNAEEQFNHIHRHHQNVKKDKSVF